MYNLKFKIMEVVMFLGKPVMAIAVTALCVGGGAATASAQQSSCANYYNQVMGAYQTMGPNSPQYNQMSADYSARCLSGAAAAPNPAYYQQPASYGYQQPAPYGYAQPAPVDPAAAIVGAAIVGGAVAGALDDNRGYNDRGYYGRRW
jgi:hypothetical protein